VLATKVGLLEGGRARRQQGLHERRRVSTIRPVQYDWSFAVITAGEATGHGLDSTIRTFALDTGAPNAR
jgi:hypothetical protein